MVSQIPPSAPSIQFGLSGPPGSFPPDFLKKPEAVTDNRSSASNRDSLDLGIGLAVVAATATAVVTSVGALVTTLLHRHGKQH